MSAVAIAVMDFAAAVGKGTVPIAINRTFTDPGTPLFINFTPDPLDNGGWFADPPDKASAKTFKDYIDDAACPPLNIGDIINLQNGLDSSVLSALDAKLQAQPADANGNRHLDAMLPVVEMTNQPVRRYQRFCPLPDYERCLQSTQGDQWHRDCPGGSGKRPARGGEDWPSGAA